MIYGIVIGFIAGCVLPPMILWALFRYDRQQMRAQVRRELRRAK